MSLVKLSSKMGFTVLFGVGKVLADKSGQVVTETEANEYGNAKYKFKIQGASRLCTDRNGREYWKTQRTWVSIDKDSPFAPIVKNLGYGDKVFVYGVLKKSQFTGDDGQTKKNLFCICEYLQLIETANGELPNIETAVDTDDEFDLDDF